MHAIELLNNPAVEKYAEICLRKAPKIVEFGVSRDFGSTRILGSMARKYNAGLVLCDPSSTAIENIARDEEYKNLSVETFCMKGEDLNYDYSDAGLFHLDGFDVITFHMTIAKHLRKKKFAAMVRNYAAQGIDIINYGNALSSMSHLKICRNIVDKTSMEEKLVLLDDTWCENGIWRGKGSTAVPFLIANGFFLCTRPTTPFWQPMKYKWGIALYRPSLD